MAMTAWVNVSLGARYTGGRATPSGQAQKPSSMQAGVERLTRGSHADARGNVEQAAVWAGPVGHGLLNVLHRAFAVDLRARIDSPRKDFAATFSGGCAGLHRCMSCSCK